MLFFLTLLYGLLVLSLLIFELIFFGSSFYSSWLGAPYVPVNKRISRELFTLLPREGRGLFVDLGSGDGRVLRGAVAAGFKGAVGYELAWWPYFLSGVLNRWYNVGERVEVIRRSLLSADISKADVVYAYLMPKMMDKVLPKLQKELLPGARFVTCLFQLRNYENSFVLVASEPMGNKRIYIYRKL